MEMSKVRRDHKAGLFHGFVASTAENGVYQLRGIRKGPIDINFHKSDMKFETLKGLEVTISFIVKHDAFSVHTVSCRCTGRESIWIFRLRFLKSNSSRRTSQIRHPNHKTVWSAFFLLVFERKEWVRRRWFKTWIQKRSFV